MKKEMVGNDIRILGQGRSQEGHTKPSTLKHTVMTPYCLAKLQHSRFWMEKIP